MDYNLYLKFNGTFDLNINDYLGGVCDTTFADIMYETDEDTEAAEDDFYEGMKIGFVTLVEYNQALAKEYGINMNQIPYITLRKNSKALMELDYSRISQETIDEIGAVTNPNIL